jgi:hypothetical protein
MALITGYKFPLEIDSSGNLVLAEDSDYISGLILSYVSVDLGERLGLPNYGLPDYLLRSYQSFGFAGDDLKRRLTADIPQAEFAVNSELDDNGQALITVFWSYNGVNQEPVIFSLADENG